MLKLPPVICGPLIITPEYLMLDLCHLFYHHVHPCSLLAHLWLTGEVLSATLKSPGVFYVCSHLSIPTCPSTSSIRPFTPPPPHNLVSQGRGFHITVPSGYPVKKEETQRKRGEVIDIQRFDGLSVSG